MAINREELGSLEPGDIFKHRFYVCHVCQDFASLWAIRDMDFIADRAIRAGLVPGICASCATPPIGGLGFLSGNCTLVKLKDELGGDGLW